MTCPHLCAGGAPEVRLKAVQHSQQTEPMFLVSGGTFR